MLQTTILMLIVDILSRFDGHPGSFYVVSNQVGNFMIFLLSPVLPSLWLLYVHNQVFHNTDQIKRLLYPLFATNAAHAVLVGLSQFYGWFYYIDAGNIYHRGPLYMLSVSITIALIIIAFILIVVNRRKIERKHYFSLVFFAAPPSACILLQILWYNMSLMLNGVVVSLLIVFLTIQNRSLFTDYLTGVNNRKKLDAYLAEKVYACSPDRTFSAILIDLDNFKAINDTYGHYMGDIALETSAKLLQSCLRSNDFIARFGGDEFFIVLDISNAKDLESTISRINRYLENYNMSSSQPYLLGFSMGYAVYDYHSHMTAEEFKKYLDTLMYENKRTSKSDGSIKAG